MFDVFAVSGADGTTIHYTDAGKGMPILFIHGWLMSGRVWALQASLAASYRVITLDLRGHGSSAGSDFSYDDCCKDIARLCEILGLSRVVVVGWSMGAQLAIKAFAAFKETVAGLLLVGGTPHFCSSSDFAPGVSPAEARSMAIRLKKNYIRTAGEFFSGMFSEAETAHLDMRMLAGSVVGSLPSLDNALSSLNELIGSDLRAALPLISVPVKLVHGSEDKICLPGAMQFMAENMPAAEAELIPAAGHAPFLADPETFNRMIAAFMQAVHG